jgi:hypothetical protein
MLAPPAILCGFFYTTYGYLRGSNGYLVIAYPGPIWWDFTKLLMRTLWKNKEVEHRGIRPPVHCMV